MHLGFAERLRRARKAAGLSHAALARSAGLASRTTTAILERGDSVPRVDTVERLASALSLSPSYLAFGSGAPTCSDQSAQSVGLPDRLLVARQLRRLSRLQLGQRSGTSHTLVRMTETGMTMPNLTKLEALATALAISPAWLAFGLEPMEPTRSSRSAATTAAL